METIWRCLSLFCLLVSALPGCVPEDSIESANGSGDIIDAAEVIEAADIADALALEDNQEIADAPTLDDADAATEPTDQFSFPIQDQTYDLDPASYAACLAVCGYWRACGDSSSHHQECRDDCSASVLKDWTSTLACVEKLNPPRDYFASVGCYVSIFP